ncbi:hypothetical protein GCM10009634_34560 [Saccharothrix xinjiangensis]
MRAGVGRGSGLRPRVRGCAGARRFGDAEARRFAGAPAPAGPALGLAPWFPDSRAGRGRDMIHAHRPAARREPP